MTGIFQITDKARLKCEMGFVSNLSAVLIRRFCLDRKGLKCQVRDCHL